MTQRHALDRDAVVDFVIRRVDPAPSSIPEVLKVERIGRHDANAVALGSQPLSNLLNVAFRAAQKWVVAVVEQDVSHGSYGVLVGEADGSSAANRSRAWP